MFVSLVSLTVGSVVAAAPVLTVAKVVEVTIDVFKRVDVAIDVVKSVDVVIVVDIFSFTRYTDVITEVIRRVEVVIVVEVSNLGASVNAFNLRIGTGDT